MAAKRLSAEHGVVCRVPDSDLGYFGWPTLARLEDGTLIAASSGLRQEHMCPYGKTVINTSQDDGASWSAPRVIHSSPLDDRDAGVVDLGGGRVLVTWMTCHYPEPLTDEQATDWLGEGGAAMVESWRPTLDAISKQELADHLGSWTIRSDDGGVTWGDVTRAPVATPHGPIRLRDGDLLYLGKRYVEGPDELNDGKIVAAHSGDGGQTWTERGSVPAFPGLTTRTYAEPHVVEFPSGKLLGMVRLGSNSRFHLELAGALHFSMMQSESEDGGRTWSDLKPLSFHGCPPHLLRHSSGRLVLVYGYRLVPFGQRVALSDDEGATWEHDWILRDDGVDFDLGYPSTVEMGDGSLMTLYYQKLAGDRQSSLLGSRWELP
ncbi:MAG: hypothetical protein CMJ84_15935 [Planctomycetes bacterium]|nr:hypothetical protein [Planctomycetota bacterium]